MLEFRAMNVGNLRQIAEGMALRIDDLKVEEGALPPRQVAQRIVLALETGTPPELCLPYLVIERETRLVVAGCNFKGEPASGVVEIGYGVAPVKRGKGVATSAVAFLLDLARRTSIVQKVVAYISPENIASQRVVSKVGFVQGAPMIDSEGEEVVQWSLRIAI